MHKILILLSVITTISISAMDSEKKQIQSKYRNGWVPTTCLLETSQLKYYPLFQAKRAIESGKEEDLKTLLDSEVFDFKPKPNEPTSMSFALLSCAIKARNPRMCELLLQAGADANAWSIDEPEGNNILSFACRRSICKRNFRGIDEICKLLLAYGAKINKRCIVEAEEERHELLPLFVRHILTQPIANKDPDFYIHSDKGLKPIYLQNVDTLLKLVEEEERPQSFGRLAESIQKGKPYLMHGLLELFKTEHTYLSFASSATPQREAEMWSDISKWIMVPQRSLPQNALEKAIKDEKFFCGTE